MRTRLLLLQVFPEGHPKEALRSAPVAPFEIIHQSPYLHPIAEKPRSTDVLYSNPYPLLMSTNPRKLLKASSKFKCLHTSTPEPLINPPHGVLMKSPIRGSRNATKLQDGRVRRFSNAYSNQPKQARNPTYSLHCSSFLG